MIADQARMRRDLQPLRAGRLLTARRADKSADRVRAIKRLQAQLLEYFPALERAFDYSRSKGALLLLTKHRTPDGIRRTGQARLHAWLKKHGTRSSAAVAAAARSQHTIVAAQYVGEGIVAALAQEIITLNEELATLDELISEKVTEHRHTQVLLSMPGFGPVLAAEFLGATGGDLTVFQTADRFAGVVGLAPAPGIPERSAATTTGPDATTAGCSGTFTSPGLRPEKLPRVPGLLRPKTCRRKNPHPGHALPGPAPTQCSLGHAARRHSVYHHRRADCSFSRLMDGCLRVPSSRW